MSDQRAGDAAAACGHRSRARCSAAASRAASSCRLQIHVAAPISAVFVDPITNHRPTQLPQATRKSKTLRLQRRLVVSQTGLCQKEACLSPQRADPSRETRLTLDSQQPAAAKQPVNSRVEAIRFVGPVVRPSAAPEPSAQSDARSARDRLEQSAGCSGPRAIGQASLRM